MKPNRKSVYDKYNGRCAYCGQEIDFKAMQVDHMVPQRSCEGHLFTAERFMSIHADSNYMPSCRSCNNYKSGNPLEAFRAALEKQIEVLRRDRPTFRLAERFGLIECKPKPVVFYFETLTPSDDTPSTSLAAFQSSQE